MDQSISQDSLLVPMGKIVLKATTIPFVARDHLVVDGNGAMKTSHFNDNFVAWFLGKVEPPFAGSTLHYRKLSCYSPDGPIIAKLGGGKEAETSLVELFLLLMGGQLNDKGVPGIFYIKDINDVLRAVGTLLNGRDRIIDAESIMHPRGWDAGSQVFSRYS